ncbi:MAG TPA: PQQ-dependent sugar dehydrogenase [Gemmatimonadaceae bacterium]|nr:PQQ-dependent sugar dehydrogenase [Gemmatimonadaceae bacterium]
MPRLPSGSMVCIVPLLSVLMLTINRSLAPWLLIGSVAFASCGSDPDSLVVPAPGPGGADSILTETVAKGFDTIWELAWGPDNAIWVTERPGTISRVNPTTGAKTPIGQISVTETAEGGLLGMAFHPDFPQQPFIYLMHTFTASNGGLRNRLVRMRYNGSSLGAPETLLDNIPGERNHDGSRIAIGPDRLLYVSTGDASTEPLAQDRNSLAGKVLRLTLDGAPAPGNPFGNATYSYGHRNPQGLVFDRTRGFLYLTEHGPSDNDEVNRIEMGRNYGWPTVRGKCDGDAGSNEIPFCQANNVVEPLANWTPTIAPSGADLYTSSAIRGWQGSLLFTSLVGRALYRLTLSSDGRRVESQERLFHNTFGRLRDVLVAPDGAVYLGTSNRDGRGSPTSDDDRIIRIRAR